MSVPSPAPAPSFLQLLGTALSVAENLAPVILTDTSAFEAGQPVAPPSPIKAYLGSTHVQIDIKVTKLPS